VTDALARETKTIPIVFVQIADPVARVQHEPRASSGNITVFRGFRFHAGW